MRAPLVASNDAALIRGKADENDALVSVPLAGQLADVDHTGPGHVRIARVANVRVVLPDNGAGCALPGLFVMGEQPVKRVDHVVDAHVPRVAAAGNHGPIVVFRFGENESILLGVEVGIGIARERFDAIADFAQEVYNLVFAVRGDDGRGARVGLDVLPIGLKAEKSAPRRIERIGRVLAQIAHHFFHRFPQAVDV